MKTDSRTFVVPVSGTTGFVELENWDTFGLIVPTLDSTTLTLQGSQDLATWVSLRDAYDVPIHVYATTVGGFGIGARDLADFVGFKYLRVLCGSAQNGGARTFTLTFDAPRRKIC